MEETTAPGFETLPAALQQHVLSFLPLVERVRCALVSRSWAALLADAAFWAELRFDGAAEGSVDEATLLQLCSRAGGRLRALDISGPACEALTTKGLLAALASDGLGLALESLRTWAPAAEHNRKTPPQPERLQIDKAAADALAAACPALASAAVYVCGTSADAGAALCGLPGPGEKRITVTKMDSSDASRGPTATLPTLAEWVRAALGAFTIAELDLPFWGDAVLAAEEEEQQAAAGLAAVLPGLRSLRFNGATPNGHSSIGQTPLVASLCSALTAKSLLTELSLKRCGVTGAGAAEIAAALAPGRSRLRTLDLSRNDLSGGGGGVALLSALGANATLSELDLEFSSLGGSEAAAALAASLRSNSTLRKLSVRGCDLSADSPPEGLAGALSALASTTEAPSRCGLAALDLSEREFTVAERTALSLALAEPTCRLKTLHLSYCHLGDVEGAEILRGLEAAGAASRLRSLDLSSNRLGGAAAAALGRALGAQGQKGALQELHLGRNEFCPAAARLLAEGLRVNSSLEYLALYGNPGIGPDGAAAIVRGIAGSGGTASSGVKTLSLAFCELGGDSAAAMLDAGLGRNATLTRLCVARNSLGEAGCLALSNWAAARFGGAELDADPPPDGSGGGRATGTRAAVQ